MPWLASETQALPEEDVVTFTFGAPSYDLDQPVYIDLDHPERTISYNQAKTLVRKLVAGFHKAGLKQGDCFSITSFNDIMFSMVFLGGVGAGGIFSGMNPAYRAHEIRHHIRTANVKFFLSEPDCVDELAQVVKSEGLPLENIFVFNVFGEPVLEGFRSWNWLLEQGEEDWVRITDPGILKDLELSRLTTSGTTGPPKFAMQTHWNGTSYHTMLSESRTTPWTPRLLSVLPSFHVATVPAVHMSPIRSGWTIFIMRRFDLEAYLAAVQKYQITDLGMVPPLVLAVIMSPLTKKYDLTSVRRIGIGAAPLDAESQNRLQALCHKDCVVTQVWGMTETSSVCSHFAYPEMDWTGSVGNKIMPNTDVKLVDDNGKDITAYDTREEICVRGPTIVKGYYKNPKANAESWDEDGYFHTGDILYCDGKSKKWYVVDRKKELIKVRGFQVAPPELEGFLLQHPGIVDCAVIGYRVNKRDANEKVRAYVVTRAGMDVSEEEVKKFVADNLARYKALTGGVVFVPEIPKSPSGKILKRLLREQVQMEVEGKARL